MLYGLMGAVITAKKPIYGVGEYPTYIITGQPDAEIFWTTYINGKEQELEMPYGDFIEPDGTVEIFWPDPFYAFQIGTWKREVTLLNPDNTKEKASLTFVVQQNPVGTPAGPPAPGQTPGTVPGAVTTPPPQTAPAPVPPPPGSSTVPPPPPRGTPTPTNPPTLPSGGRGQETIPPPPGTNPPGTVTTPPIIPVPPGDILNPAPVPPRDIYPPGQEPRPPIDRGGPIERPVVTAPPGDILNPTPLPPSLPSPLPAPVPPQLPGAGLPPGSTGPMPQGPSAGSGFDLGGSVNIGGMSLPVWLVAVGVLFLFKGR